MNRWSGRLAAVLVFGPFLLHCGSSENGGGADASARDSTSGSEGSGSGSSGGSSTSPSSSGSSGTPSDSGLASSSGGGGSSGTSSGSSSGASISSGSGGSSSGPGGGSSGSTTGAGCDGGVCAQSCPAVSGGPAGIAPLPSALQVAYQRTELTAFIHLGLATYDGTEQGNLADSPSLFNPTNLTDAVVASWMADLKSAGFGQVMLTAKHSTGYCLWPSKIPCVWGVESSPWQQGEGDIVKMFVTAARAAGLRPALYLAPWDQKFTSSSASYETYYKAQLTELLTNYGPFYELELDGFNAPGSHGFPATVNWQSFIDLAKQLNPGILVWAGPEITQQNAAGDIQWIGNENGQASRTTSSTVDTNCGRTNSWCAWECNVSDRQPDWFWHPNQTPMSLSRMQQVYFETVGMNGTLIFNVPPMQTGEFDPQDVKLLQNFSAWYTTTFKTDVLKGQPVTADSTWATAGFDATKAVDDDVCTYWAAASGNSKGRLEVTPPSSVSFQVISIREPIEIGERTTAYHVEVKQNGNWTTPTDSGGTKVQGTVIGNRQLWNLAATQADGVALVIDSAKGVPAIAEFSVY